MAEVSGTIHGRSCNPIADSGRGVDSCGNIRYAQTMAFTTLALFQLFNAFSARSEEASAFEALFSNHWLWAAITLSLLLHCAVLYIPFLQEVFSTTGLNGSDWLLCVAVASCVLWLGELT
jgi:P-type Ca2+ transporter type 2C